MVWTSCEAATGAFDGSSAQICFTVSCHHTHTHISVLTLMNAYVLMKADRRDKAKNVFFYKFVNLCNILVDGGQSALHIVRYLYV